MYTIRVNDVEHELDVDSAMPVLWALRDVLGLIGTKYGCGIALCGACTIHVDGVPVRSCSVSVADVAGRSLRTIEGLARGSRLHALIDAFLITGNDNVRELLDGKGDVSDVFADPANTTREAFYEFPFVAHLCMEPMNCTAHYKKGSAGDALELWIPIQGPGRVFPVAKSMFGLEQDQVTMHQVRLGGSFGRRVYTEYICEVIEISKRVGAPVKLTWTREDDIHHDFFRVGGFQSVKGAVDRQPGGFRFAFS